MGFNEVKWEFSDEVAEDVPRKEISVGEHDLLIKYAELKDRVYYITLSDLNDDECESVFRYWLDTTDKFNQIVKNVQARGTLVTLGEALAGKCIGIPEPNSIIGGIVHADVKLSKPNAEGKTYLRIYKFEPVIEDIALCAAIEQYYIGAETDD